MIIQCFHAKLIEALLEARFFPMIVQCFLEASMWLSVLTSNHKVLSLNLLEFS